MPPSEADEPGPGPVPDPGAGAIWHSPRPSGPPSGPSSTSPAAPPDPPPGPIGAATGAGWWTPLPEPGLPPAPRDVDDPARADPAAAYSLGAPPPPPDLRYPEQELSAGPPRPTRALLVVGAVLLPVAVALAVVGGRVDMGAAPRESQLGPGPPPRVVPTPSAQPTVQVTSDPPSSPSVTSSEPVSASRGQRRTSEPQIASPAEAPLVPVSVTATQERPSVQLRCTGESVSYAADRLVDGDLDTGWGASRGDGAGESVRIEFGERVRLSTVGLTPGFLKRGARQDRGCAVVDAFPLNRFVRAVRYTFDDGSSHVQHFDRRRALQTERVDVETESVLVTLLDTDRPAGADNDTILSEATFIGSPS